MQANKGLLSNVFVKIGIFGGVCSAFVLLFGKQIPVIDEWSRARVIEGKQPEIDRCNIVLKKYYKDGTDEKDASKCVEFMREVMDFGVQSNTRYPKNKAFDPYNYQNAHLINSVTNNASDKLKSIKYQ